MSFQGRRLVEPAGRRLFSPTWKCPSQGPASRMASTMLSSSMFMWKVSSSTRALGLPRRLTNSTPSLAVLSRYCSKRLTTSQQ